MSGFPLELLLVIFRALDEKFSNSSFLYCLLLLKFQPDDKGIVINQASQVNMENIKVEDPEAPGIQIKNATGIIINGKEYKKDSGKMLLSGNQRN